MRLKLVFILLVIFRSVVIYPYSHQLPLDLPIAESIGEPGVTAYRFDVSSACGPSLQIGRSVGRRLDIWMNTSFSDLFFLRARALLINRLGPLNMSIDVSADGFTFLSAMFLGPVQIDVGRAFSGVGQRWIAISSSPNQRCSFVFGLEYKTRYYLIAAARLFPHRGLWGMSIYLRDGEWGLSFGGIL
jgi:hypothetical protein